MTLVVMVTCCHGNDVVIVMIGYLHNVCDKIDSAVDV